MCRITLKERRSAVISKMVSPANVRYQLNLKGGLKEEIPFFEDKSVLAALIIDTILDSPDQVLQNFLQILSSYDGSLHHYFQQCGARKTNKHESEKPKENIQEITPTNNEPGSALDLEKCRITLREKRSEVISGMVSPAKVRYHLNLKGGLKEQIPFHEDKCVLATLIIETILESPDHILQDFLQILSSYEGNLHYYFQQCGARKTTMNESEKPKGNIQTNNEPDIHGKKSGVLPPRREPRFDEQIRSEGSYVPDKVPEYQSKDIENYSSEKYKQQQTLQVRSGKGTGQRRTPVPINANDLDTPFHVGSVVEIKVAHQNQYGVIRWIGYYDSPEKPIAGIELEKMTPAGTDGTYLNVRLFTCSPKRAMFMFLKNCKPDRRFLEEPEAYNLETMLFHVTCGNQKLLVDAEASVFNVRSAIRKAFVIPDRDGLTVQYWHQEEGFEDWVELRDDSFRYLSGTMRNRLNVIVDERDPNPEGENMNRQLARALEDAYILYLVSDESLFDADHG